MSTRFDFDKAVATWRHVHARRRAFMTEDLDELERHLRDHTADLVAHGLAEEDAFRAAVQALGDIDGGADEYGKVYWGKLRRRRGAVAGEMKQRFELLGNDIKLAWRHLMRKKGYAAIHLGGLAVGMACFLIMALYVQYERSYDRHIPDVDRIHRVTLEETSDGQSAHRAVTPPALAPALMRDVTGVERAVRFGLSATAIEAGGQRFPDVRLARGDTAFFTVFNFPFVAGDPKSALHAPDGAVLTRSTALRLFGNTDVLGETLQTPDLRFVDVLSVTGVVEDIPPNTHFAFDLIAHRSAVLPPNVGSAGDDQWWLYGDYTYVLLSRNTTADHVARQLPPLSERYLSDRPGNSVVFHLQPVTRIHLHSHLDKEFQPNGRAAYVYLLGGIGLLVLILACINFINLATARATRRAREVGVRKTMGAGRSRLIVQFLTESMLLVAGATLLAIALMFFGLPLLERLAGVSLPVRGPLFMWMLYGLPLLMLVVSLVAGAYPAFVLSGFRPTAMLKPGGSGPAAHGALVRRGLVVTQFASSIALLIGTGVVYQQITFMQEADPGFAKEHVVVVTIPNAVRDSYDPETIRQTFLRHGGILEVGFSRFVPTENVFTNGSPIPEGADQEVPVYWHNVDSGYMNALGLQLLAGHGFTNLTAADSAGSYGAFVVNETAVRQFGWMEPIGKALLNPFDRRTLGRVVGVVADFHLTSLQEEIGPLVYFFSREGRGFRRVLVRLAPGQTSDVLAFIEGEWSKLMPDQPFSYFFLKDSYAALYAAEERLNGIVAVFAALAIFIACLGLFGLAAFSAEQRTKEIGIRKVLGATVPGIIGMLSKDFLTLVGVAFAVAAPVALLLVQRWLRGFAYHVEIGPGIFVLAGTLVLVLAVLTVSYQSIRAATRNPVLSLRYE